MKLMNSHSAYVIGKAHAVCQDYAVAKVEGATAYAIVADGCSSSPDTDMGARLLVKSAERSIVAPCKRDALFHQAEHEAAARQALRYARALQLSPQSVDATLLTIKVSGARFSATCYGDGSIALQSRTGRLDVYSISFADGYPRYPVYAAQPERQRFLETRAMNLKDVTHYSLVGGDTAAVQIDRRTSDDLLETFSGDVRDYRLIAALTDGFNSFVRVTQSETSKRVEPIGLEKLIGNLLSFKNTNGEFVRRRLNKFLSDAQKNNWQHQDDLGIAVVYLGD